VNDCDISSTRTNNSPAGAGLAVIGSENVAIDSGEIARNVLEGIYIADSRNVQVQGCLIEGNESNGIGVVSIANGGALVEVRESVLQNNAKPAIAKMPDLSVTIHPIWDKDNGVK